MLMEGLLQYERKHMKALVYTSANKVTYRDEPSPEPARGEAKILMMLWEFVVQTCMPTMVKMPAGYHH